LLIAAGIGAWELRPIPTAHEVRLEITYQSDMHAILHAILGKIDTSPITVILNWKPKR
jgi:hypothetical protein